MAQKLYEETNIQAIAQAIRDKNGLTTTYKTSEMAAAIAAIPSGGGGGIPADAMKITGDCYYRFYYNGWNDWIGKYGQYVTTEGITDARYMFSNNTQLTNIPFSINFGGCQASLMFNSCEKLLAIPKLTGKVYVDYSSMFTRCCRVREIDTSGINFDVAATTKLYGLFSNCYSLRTMPVNLPDTTKISSTSTNYSSYYLTFNNCYTLDEIRDMVVQCSGDYASKYMSTNMFSNFVGNCNRLKSFTFATKDNGGALETKWKSQTLDLSTYVGYTSDRTRITSYNSGITADKEVIDDATYQALKNDPDWFTCNVAYSRYNHDSAVETINSLPNTKDYGTNTIKFKGDSGSSTDGGAVNTLTEEEIAVAAAKGWTVTLV